MIACKYRKYTAENYYGRNVNANNFEGNKYIGITTTAKAKAQDKNNQRMNGVLKFKNIAQFDSDAMLVYWLIHQHIVHIYTCVTSQCTQHWMCMCVLLFYCLHAVKMNATAVNSVKCEKDIWIKAFVQWILFEIFKFTTPSPNRMHALMIARCVRRWWWCWCWSKQFSFLQLHQNAEIQFEMVVHLVEIRTSTEWMHPHIHGEHKREREREYRQAVGFKDISQFHRQYVSHKWTRIE